jgi:peptidoglycan/xylan/chitin deacetylase (PgdA/CDA1 family)
MNHIYPDDYLKYPQRKLGLDHELFAHRRMKDAKPLLWPAGARLAVCLRVPIQHFPLDMEPEPFAVPGGMERIYPSYWDFTLRDYGNRIGIYRLMRSMDQVGWKASATVNADVVDRCPGLLDQLLSRKWEVVASGLNMGKLQHGGTDPDDERKVIESSKAVFQRACGATPEGWHSPAYSESASTPHLVREAGFRYLFDWGNDESPYLMKTRGGPLLSMPAAYELSDQRVIHQQGQSLAEFEEQINAAFDFSLNPARTTGDCW